MITLVGTGHIFKIAEPVSFIVKNIWPDAVLVELDRTRYDAITSPRSPDADAGAGAGTNAGAGDTASKQYRKMAEYQRDMAESYDSKVGAEFIAAIGAGKMIGAAIEFIDKDAQETMRELWNEMTFTERMRFRLSRFGDLFRKKKGAETVVAEFAEDEESYIKEMRRKYPTLVRKLIDERNEHMSSKINEAALRYGNIIVVVGDAHVEGLAKLISPPRAAGASPEAPSALSAERSCEAGIRKIRLKTLMNAELMNELRKELWSGRSEDIGSPSPGTATASGTETEHSSGTAEERE